MELFNIGPLEFILIILLAVVILGPERMVKGAYSLGRWINTFVRSPMWKEIMSTSQDIRELPTKILRDTGLEESLNEIKQTTQDVTTELNSTLKQANDEVKQAVDEANAEVRQATNELNDTARQALNDANQEVGKISNPDVIAEPKIDEIAVVDPGETQPVDQAETQAVETPEVEEAMTLDQVLAIALEAPPVDPVELQTADIVELKPMPVLSHLQEVPPEILPQKPSTSLPADLPVDQSAANPARTENETSQVVLEELYEAKLNHVLEQYEVELKRILEQYKADLKKAAPPVEETSHPEEIAVQDKLE